MIPYEISTLILATLFTSGVVAIAVLKVPAWKAMDSERFKADFAKTIRVADKLQPILLAFTIGSALLAAINLNGLERTLFATAAVLSVIIMGLSLGILVPLQKRILATTHTDAVAFTTMKERWFTGHIGRSVLSAIVLVVCAISLFIM